MNNNEIIKRELLTAALEWGTRRNAILMSDNGRNLFSGVFACLDNKYYVITACHCIDDIQNISTLLLSTYGYQSPGLRVSPVRIERLRQYDLAAIELSEMQANSLNATWMIRDGISSADATPAALVCLPGFPAQIQRMEEETSNVLRPSGLYYFSQLTMRHQEIPQDHINQSTDILIEYDQANTFALDDSQLPGIEPHGMSGCGVFVVPRPQDDELWTANNIKLAGIQSSYYRNHNLLIGKRIEYISDAL